MSFRSMPLVFGALLMASPLAAQSAPEPGPSPGPTPSPIAKVKKPRPICRDVGSTGSHFSSRVCHSAEDWIVIDRNAQNTALIDDRGK